VEGYRVVDRGGTSQSGLCLKLMDVFNDDGSQDGVQRDLAGPQLFLVLGLLNETADSRLHNLRI